MNIIKNPGSEPTMIVAGIGRMVGCLMEEEEEDCYINILLHELCLDLNLNDKRTYDSTKPTLDTGASWYIVGFIHNCIQPFTCTCKCACTMYNMYMYILTCMQRL